ncbi:unnamed protein product [Nesidiocoris tenuis]|uniref:methenyltetrahydrofolate cyclohydrolase n=1 Tax=Nesidiocoris tenuis TaxID=355587 RepID=A0A6H5GG28_9HEMI|nr:unnamed protein product [Nesidiocoris tenuis]
MCTRSRNKSTVIDGKLVFENVLKDLRQEISAFVASGNKPPILTALTAGYDPSSLSYVKIKRKAAQSVGVDCNIVELRSSYTDDDVLRIISQLNKDDRVDGILVQLPLFPHNNERIICDAVAHRKDVDGTSAASLGNLCLNTDHFIPCTALAVHHILKNVIGLDYCGKRAVVIGRSKHVGLPIAILLHSSEQYGDIEGLNMTTTIAHRHTPRNTLIELSSSADVLVSAAGVPGLVTADMVKPGAIVLDVGVTKTVTPEGKSVFKGDVNFADVQNKVMYITSVPGGIGPVTVGMLMRNVFKSARIREAKLRSEEAIKTNQNQ